jgi:spermidine/putrescine transport system permease protein
VAARASRLFPRRRARVGAGGPRYPGWLALPATAWYSFFFLGPLGIMALYSVAHREGYTKVVYGFSLDNFRYLWDPLYGHVFLRTLGLATFGTIATLLVGFPFAYYLARYAKRKTLLLLLIVIPFWTSFLIRTYAWLIILSPDFPLFRWLRHAGITSESFSLLYTPKAIYIGVVYNYLPLMVLPLYAALERVDWTLVEAAQDLGDSPWRAFRRITLPLAVPGVVAGSLLVFIPLTGEYLIPVVLGGNTTIYAGQLIAQQFNEAHDWPFGAAVAMVVIGAMTIVLVTFSRIAARAEVQHG